MAPRQGVWRLSRGRIEVFEKREAGTLRAKTARINTPTEMESSAITSSTATELLTNLSASYEYPGFIDIRFDKGGEKLMLAIGEGDDGNFEATLSNPDTGQGLPLKSKCNTFPLSGSSKKLADWIKALADEEQAPSLDPFAATKVTALEHACQRVDSVETDGLSNAMQ